MTSASGLPKTIWPYAAAVIRAESQSIKTSAWFFESPDKSSQMPLRSAIEAMLLLWFATIMEPQVVGIIVVALFAGGAAAVCIAFLVRTRRARRHLVSSSHTQEVSMPPPEVSQTQEALKFASLVREPFQS